MARIVRSRAVVALLAAVLALGLVAGCSGGGQDEAADGGDEGTSDAITSENPDAATYAMGETFELNGLTWKVVDFETLDEVESMFSDTPPHKPENGMWLVATLEFQGAEGTPGGYNADLLKLRDADGNYYDVAEPSGAADDYRLTHEDVKNLSLAMLGDSEVQRVFAIYDVPADAGPFTLEWMDQKGVTYVTQVKVELTE